MSESQISLAVAVSLSLQMALLQWSVTVVQMVVSRQY